MKCRVFLIASILLGRSIFWLFARPFTPSLKDFAEAYALTYFAVISDYLRDEKYETVGDAHNEAVKNLKREVPFAIENKEFETSHGNN